jgi:hypothetical protein
VYVMGLHTYLDAVIVGDGEEAPLGRGDAEEREVLGELAAQGARPHHEHTRFLQGTQTDPGHPGTANPLAAFYRSLKGIMVGFVRLELYVRVQAGQRTHGR